jgi:N-acyl amino acid synthase FeeM
MKDNDEKVLFGSSMEFQTRFIRREDRRIARQALTGKHGFKAIVQTDGKGVDASLSDFSSIGFAITLGPSIAGDFSVGDRIHLKVSPLIGHIYDLKGLIIDLQTSKQGQVKISAVIEHAQDNPHGDYSPVHMSPEQSLKGQLVHPFAYKQSTYFEVESLSTNGFFATNINSDFTLFDNMEVELSMGTVLGLQNVKGRVSNVSLTQDNQVRCFIALDVLPSSAQEELSQHCFHFAQKTPAEIEKAGLKSHKIQKFVQYRFVETQAEYEAVLKLRRKAYARIGLCAKDEAIARFALSQDAYGRILIAFHNARVIGSALLVFGEKGSQPLEMEGLLPRTSFTRLPNYEEIMEITEVCIERHYQDTDVLQGIFENMYREGLSAGKNYILVGSSPDFVDQYKNMGFKPFDLQYQNPRNHDMTMTVMLLNKETGISGKGMNPLRWWQVWGYVSMHLYQRRIIEYSALQKLRVYTSRALSEAVERLKSALSRL